MSWIDDHALKELLEPKEEPKICYHEEWRLESSTLMGDCYKCIKCGEFRRE